MRNILRIVLVWGALVTATQGAEQNNVLGIRVPDSLDEMLGTVHEDPDTGFRFRGGYSAYLYQGLRQYDDPELGYSLGYAAPNGTDLSVYVYDMGVADIPNGPDSALVAQQLTDAERGIAASGRYTQVQRLLEPPRLSPHFAQYSHLLTTSAGQPIKSHTFVRGQSNRFIKVRVTGSAGEALEPRVAAFLEQLSAGLGIAEATEHSEHP